MDEAISDVPLEVCPYVRKLLTLANDHEILKGASFDVPLDRHQCNLSKDGQRGTQRCAARRQPSHYHGCHQGRVRFENECNYDPWSTEGDVCSYG